MPRDAQGRYSLPASYLAVPLQKITSVQHNAPLEDIAKYLDKYVIPDGEITTAKLADGVVTTAKLADNAVIEAKLAANSVTTFKIADKSVTNAKLADNSVTSAIIADAQVGSAELAPGAVIEDKIGNGAVTESKIAPGAVSPGRLSAGAPYWQTDGSTRTGNFLAQTNGNTQIVAESTTTGIPNFRLINTVRRWVIRLETNGDWTLWDDTANLERIRINTAGNASMGGDFSATVIRINANFSLAMAGQNQPSIFYGAGGSRFAFDTSNGTYYFLVNNAIVGQINTGGFAGDISQATNYNVAGAIVSIPDRGVGTFISVVSSAGVYVAGTNYPGSGRLPAGGTWRCQYESRWFVANIDDFSVFSFKRVA
jgi:hypothetical protein